MHKLQQNNSNIAFERESCECNCTLLDGNIQKLTQKVSNKTTPSFQNILPPELLDYLQESPSNSALRISTNTDQQQPKKKLSVSEIKHRKQRQSKHNLATQVEIRSTLPSNLVPSHPVLTSRYNLESNNNHTFYKTQPFSQLQLKPYYQLPPQPLILRQQHPINYQLSERNTDVSYSHMKTVYASSSIPTGDRLYKLINFNTPRHQYIAQYPSVSKEGENMHHIAIVPVTLVQTENEIQSPLLPSQRSFRTAKQQPILAKNYMKSDVVSTSAGNSFLGGYPDSRQKIHSSQALKREPVNFNRIVKTTSLNIPEAEYRLQMYKYLPLRQSAQFIQKPSDSSISELQHTDREKGDRFLKKPLQTSKDMAPKTTYQNHNDYTKKNDHMFSRKSSHNTENNNSRRSKSRKASGFHSQYSVRILEEEENSESQPPALSPKHVQSEYQESQFGRCFRNIRSVENEENISQTENNVSIVVAHYDHKTQSLTEVKRKIEARQSEPVYTAAAGEDKSQLQESGGSCSQKTRR